MFAHGHDFGDNGLLGPLDTKHVRQLLEVYRCRLTDAENRVAEPCHAQGSQLVVKELHAELSRNQGDILDDGLSDSPLLILGQLHDGRQDGLRQAVDTDNYGVKVSSYDLSRWTQKWAAYHR